MKGILTNCITGIEEEVELDYEIRDDEGRKSFWLTNGVTGYESFVIDSKYTNLKAMSEHGWMACIGTENVWDKLFVPPEEIKKVLEKEGLI